jgi:hypothetical protein
MRILPRCTNTLIGLIAFGNWRIRALQIVAARPQLL